MTVLVTICGAQAAASAPHAAQPAASPPPQAEHPLAAAQPPPHESHAGAASQLDPQPELQLDSQQDFLRNNPASAGPARLTTSSATAGVRLNNRFNMMLL